MTPAYCRAELLLPEIRNTNGFANRICTVRWRQPRGVVANPARKRKARTGATRRFMSGFDLADMRFSGVPILQRYVQFANLVCQAVVLSHVERERWLCQGFGRGDSLQ